MRNKLFVKVLAVLLANLFLMGTFNSSANPIIDELDANKTQSHDTHSYSYFRNQSSETQLLSADRTLEFTVYDDETKQPVSLVNFSVRWTSQATLFGGDVVKGVAIGAGIGVGIAVAALVIAAVFTGGATLPVAGALIAGGVGGAVIGGVIASQQDNFDGKPEFYQTDANGKIRITRPWQDNVEIVIDLSVETEVSKYSAFKPTGQPYWKYSETDQNKIPKNLMECDIYLVSFDTEGGYLANLRIAQAKVGNLTYVETVDNGAYEEDTNFKPINMHNPNNAENYADECDHTEWAHTDFWRGRTTVYPDGKGSDITWVETKRLIFIKDLTGISEFSLNATYKNADGEIIYQGAPAGAFFLENGTNVGLDAGEYWYFQWIWCVGRAEFGDDNATITVEVFIYVDGDAPEEPNAGIETYTLFKPQHIIEFTFSDSSLVNNVHHRVFAERGIPTVHGDLRYNLYSTVNEVDVRASGIQTLPDEWETEYGTRDLFFPTCEYGYYFAIEDNEGDEVFQSATEMLEFDTEDMTAFDDTLDVSNITFETSYRLTLNNIYFLDGGGETSTMSSTLFFQLTDWDAHQNLSEETEKLIDETFAVTGAGTYGNFDSSHINELKQKYAEMNAKLELQESRLNQFIDDNGESNYTGKCQEMINNFRFFYGLFQDYASASPSELASNPEYFTQFRGLCNVMLWSFNHAYLYYSCSIAYANGDMEIVDELVDMMAFEDTLIKRYKTSLEQPPTWDLTLIIMIIIALIIATIVTAAIAGWYNKREGAWKSADRKKLAVMFALIFISVFALSFAIMFVFLWAQFYSWFGHIPTGGR